ncbi:MAG: hypothetical protein V4734_13015, partial [Terriglobus sp.]
KFLPAGLSKAGRLSASAELRVTYRQRIIVNITFAARNEPSLLCRRIEAGFSEGADPSACRGQSGTARTLNQHSA